MSRLAALLLGSALAASLGCAPAAPGAAAPAATRDLARPDEPHLRRVRQLSFEGENAEAYWNREGTELIFQSTRGTLGCDQIFRMGADGSRLRQVSVGGGRTTCGYFRPDGSILYASTHAAGPGCLAEPDRSQGYVWPLHPEMDLWQAGPEGEGARLLFQSAGYDAEATVCHRDGRIVFTSDMDGDLELYGLEADGSGLRRLTFAPGYDGGAFFSPDCSKLVWRASRPEGPELAAYRELLARHRVRPGRLEIFVAHADGSDPRQVTRNGAANFAPYLHPDNQRVIFASNQHDPAGRNFDLYLIRVDGTGQERVTTDPSFDGFPMFSHDGRRLAFASNRASQRPGETNVFVAEWVE
jgi:Tol biopolymer transport system component